MNVIFRLIIILALIIFTANTYAEETLSPDIQRILSQHKLIVGVSSQDTPPFFWHDKNGNLVGYDITLAQNLAKHLGVPIEFNQTAKNFDELVELLVNRKVDIAVSLLSQTLPRALKISFSDPYLILPKVLVVNRAQASQNNLEQDIENRLPKINNKSLKIGVLANSSYVLFAKEEYPNLTIVPYINIQQALDDVQDGKIFAVFFNTVQVKHYLENDPDSALYLRFVPLVKDPDLISIGVPWSDTHFLSWINLYLTVVKSDNTLQQIYKNYVKGLA